MDSASKRVENKVKQKVILIGLDFNQVPSNDGFVSINIYTNRSYYYNMLRLFVITPFFPFLPSLCEAADLGLGCCDFCDIRVIQLSWNV